MEEQSAWERVLVASRTLAKRIGNAKLGDAVANAGDAEALADLLEAVVDDGGDEGVAKWPTRVKATL